jgi:hypothetical protein
MPAGDEVIIHVGVLMCLPLHACHQHILPPTPLTTNTVSTNPMLTIVYCCPTLVCAAVTCRAPKVAAGHSRAPRSNPSASSSATSVLRQHMTASSAPAAPAHCLLHAARACLSMHRSRQSSTSVWACIRRTQPPCASQLVAKQTGRTCLSLGC